MENTIAVPNVSRGAAPLQGRAIGALICGVFGAIWMFEAVYFGAVATPVSLTITALLATIFVAWPASKVYSLGRGAGSSARASNWAEISKAYWTIVAVESVACIVAANVLANIGRPDLMPQFIGAIVGIHFLPLAKIFKAPIYNWTGAVMVLGVLASFVIPAGSFRNLAAYGICGYSLWATAIVILCKDKFSSTK
jgi:hypothetical protein